MNPIRPLTITIAALGGQGGGVLADWLNEAARIAGYRAQATSIPGIAQRTGATTYYLELFPQKQPPATPVFSLYPDAGDVDLVVALEPTEAGRAMEGGFVTEGTTVITARERIYSTAEKIIAGDGAMRVESILGSLTSAAKALISLDVQSIESESGAKGNAIILGAIAGTSILPLSNDDFRAAISAKGTMVESNLRGFEAGLAQVSSRTEPVKQEARVVYAEVPLGFENRVEGLAPPLRSMVGHGLARLLDYQDKGYAELYLERLMPVFDLDDTDNSVLSVTVARYLAAWMSYEDVVRVAQLKTRPGRIARIKGELGAAASDPVQISDYLKPGLEELASLMPPAIGRRIMNSAKQNPGNRGIPLKIKTTSFSGYSLFSLLAMFRRWRPHSYRFQLEQEAIECWLSAVTSAAKQDLKLATKVAELAVWARGYGGVRNRGFSRLNQLFADWENKLAEDIDGLFARVECALDAAKNDPDGCAAN